MIVAGGDRKLKVGTMLKDWVRGEKLVEFRTVDTDGSSAVTTAVVNIGSPTAGQMVLIVFRNATAGTIAFPAGWTQLANSSADSSVDTVAVAYRICDGTEGATINVTQGTAARFAAIAWVCTNASDPIWPGLVRVTGGASAAIDPIWGGITPGVINLFLAVHTHESPDDTTVFPSDPWVFGSTAVNTGSTGAGVAMVQWSFKYVRANRDDGLAATWSTTASHAAMSFGILIPPA